MGFYGAGAVEMSKTVEQELEKWTLICVWIHTAVHIHVATAVDSVATGSRIHALKRGKVVLSEHVQTSP